MKPAYGRESRLTDTSRIGARFAVLIALLVLGAIHSPCRAAEASTPDEVDLQRIFAGGEPESIAELKAMEQHQQKLAKEVVACTVGVVVGPAHGSGVIVSEDGYVLTAAHVAGKPERPATIILPDGRRARAKTLGLHRTMDAGLMKITDKGPWPHAEMGDSRGIEKGAWCAVTGHPGGYEESRNPVFRVGRVLLTDKFAITTDCTLVGGDSGGPLFDMSGKVIGINSRIGRFLTANMHVPVGTYRETWNRLVSGDAWGHLPGTGPYIGVEGDVNSDAAKIAAVFPNTPAQKAGIKPGDVIIEFAGKPVSDFASLQLLVNDSQPGDKVELRIRRGRETVELELVIGKRKQ
jgi:serine protease Do